VSFLPARDYFDDERWSAAVRAGVAKVASPGDRVTLIGFRKDRPSSDLDNFPGWTQLEIEPDDDINSTDLCEIYFGMADHAAALAIIARSVEPGVIAYLEAWLRLPAYQGVVAEHNAVVAYRKKWGAPVALTADSVLTASGHVLLIRRGGDIGHGLWALPGGFLDPNERFYAAAIRELAEETGFSPPPSLLKSALRGEAVFDHPLRCVRGRIVTQAFHFDLGDVPPPAVQGSDDAKEARWIPIADVAAMEEQVFEDHATILDHFLRLWP
jgi:bifunctional NMN adenylyltransferase/nudix hydrolase